MSSTKPKPWASWCQHDVPEGWEPIPWEELGCDDALSRYGIPPYGASELNDGRLYPPYGTAYWTGNSAYRTQRHPNYGHRSYLVYVREIQEPWKYTESLTDAWGME